MSMRRTAERLLRKAATFRAASRPRARSPRAPAPAVPTARASARSSGFAIAKIAPTHENESANEAVATLSGRTSATKAAAMASEFQENAARPKARAVSATVTIVAARMAGSCAPLHSAKHPHRKDGERARNASRRHAERKQRERERRNGAEMQTGGDEHVHGPGFLKLEP